MGRPRRIQLASLNYHLIGRCVDRSFFITEPVHFERFLSLLARYKAQYRILLHTYVIMSNHYHLLVTPTQDDTLARFMQALMTRYAQWQNALRGRTGHFWERRYHSVCIQKDHHALVCMRYIERNPVRADLVTVPWDYPWSSSRYYVLGQPDGLIDPHPTYSGLARTPPVCQRAYRSFLSEIPRSEDVKRPELTEMLAYGDEEFIQKPG